jgi:hypothetical protein
MKVELLCLNTANKLSLISKCVTEIRINSPPCKGINQTTQYTQAKSSPRVATVHDTVRESGWVLPRPSTVFHAYASADTLRVAQILYDCTPVKRGKVSSNSLTHEATQFRDSICPVCASTFRCLFNRAQPTRALIDTGGGYHLRALNFRPYSHPRLVVPYSHTRFPSSILRFPLIALLGLILNHSINYSSSQHSNTN